MQKSYYASTRALGTGYSRRHEEAASVLAVGAHDARVASGTQRRLHHRPVLRVAVQVADVAAAARAHEARRSQLTHERRPAIT